MRIEATAGGWDSRDMIFASRSTNVSVGGHWSLFPPDVICNASIQARDPQRLL